MEVYLNFRMIAPLVSAILSLYIIVYFLLKGKKAVLLYSFLSVQFFIFIGLVGAILVNLLFFFGIYSTVILWFTNYIMIGTVYYFLPGSLLVFSVYYTRSGLKRNKLFISAVFIVPCLFFLLFSVESLSVLARGSFHLLTNHLRSIFSGLGMVVSFGYKLMSFILLVKYTMRQSGNARKQSLVLTLSVFYLLLVYSIVDISAMISSYGAPPPESYYVISGFVASPLLFTIAIFKYGFLDVIPLALRKIVDGMKQSIVVIDNSNRVIDANQSFAVIFKDLMASDDLDDTSKWIAHLKKSLLEKSDLKDRVIKAIEEGADEPVEGELNLGEPLNARFYVSVQPLLLNNRKKSAIGRIVSFYDISEYRKLVEDLAVANERNRLAGEVHDTVGHSLTKLITLLHVGKITCETDPVQTREQLVQAIAIAKDGLNELRRSVAGFQPQKLENEDLTVAIQQLADDFRVSGIKIDFTTDGVPARIQTGIADTLYRACQEALTNSVRHGKAGQVTIVLRFAASSVKLLMIDDGCGCSDIKKGFGLTAMENRVKALNGSLEYGSVGDGGFNIFIEIPL